MISVTAGPAPHPRRWSRLLLPLLAVTLAVSGAGVLLAPSSVAASPTVVISQVYGGGGNSGAPLSNDYVELFNRGSEPVDLAGWSVQYASAAGTGAFGASAAQLTVLSGVLAPGQYFLIQEAGGATGAALTPDLVDPDPINLSGSAGKVALVNSTSSLGCNGGSIPCSPVQQAQIVDLIGYGAANFFEGEGPAPALSNTTAAARATDGCQDTDQNSADFGGGAPAPRNLASPQSSCTGDSGPAVTSTTPAAGDTEVAVDTDVAIEFSESVEVTGDWFTLSCTVSGAHPGTAGGGPQAFTIDPAADFANGEDCTLSVVGALVSDVDAEDPPDVAVDSQVTFSTVGADGPACVPAPAISPISRVQGSTDVSPCVDRTVAVDGIVVGDYEGPAPALRGFYVQEPDAEVDADPATSEAIFVFNGNTDSVQLGDRVTVTGTVGEFQGQTQISASAVTVAGSGATVTPAEIVLPVPSADYLERYEGMLARAAQTLTVTEAFQLGRFGEIVVSSGGRLAQPTAVAAPGAAAQAVQAANDLNRLRIDDASNGQNPDPILFGRGGNPLTADNTLRGGDTVTDVVGVLTYTWAGNAASGNAYRLRVVGDLSDSGLTPGGVVPAFAPANERPSAAPEVGGSLQVSAFNVLNYFVTLDAGDNLCGTTEAPLECRGAETAEELERQRAKLLTALSQLDADVLGLVELENTTGVEPLADIVAGLNDLVGADTYAFVETGTVGTDAIKVGLIYRLAAVTPVGDYAVLDKSVDPRFDSDNMRPSLAQSFRDNSTGEVLTVVVNHLKSKGCDSSSAPADADQGDGQGCFNAMRTAAAAALRDWVAGRPTGVQDDDTLLVGDLNSYNREDPISTLTSAGWVDLASALVGPSAYSYVFDGQWGYLDYALASPSLAAQVTGAAEYHINADEPSVLDYNTNFKTPGQISGLYEPDEFRTSDHDPIVVGLALNGLPGARALVLPTQLSRPDGGLRLALVFGYDRRGLVETDIEAATSSEPDCGAGYGSRCGDIRLIGNQVVALRAEAFDRGGRTYTILARLTNGSQTVYETLTVRVPKR